MEGCHRISTSCTQYSLYLIIRGCDDDFLSKCLPEGKAIGNLASIQLLFFILLSFFSLNAFVYYVTLPEESAE